MNYLLRFKASLIIISALLFAFLLIGCGGDKVDRLNQLFEDLTIVKRTGIVEDFEVPKFLGAGDGAGNYDHEISWVSANEDVLSVGGLNAAGTKFNVSVTRPDEDTNVILTATITLNKNGATRAKPFTISIVGVVDSTEYDTTLEVKQAVNATDVTVKGVVTYVNDIGLYVQDSVGSLFVYNASKPTVVIGDEVVIVGKRATHMQMPQIGSPTITKVGTKSASITPQTMSYEAIVSKTTANLEFFGTFIKLEGLLVASGDVEAPYAIEDVLSTNSIKIRKYTVASAQAELAALVNEYVELTFIIYDYASGWRVVYVEGTVAEKQMPAISDEIKLDLTETALLEQFDGIIINKDINLPTTNSYGVEITWTGGTGTISNTGEYTAPLSDNEDVTFTVNLKSGTLESSVTIVMTALKASDPTELNVIINQVYGGGGNTGATFTHDFIELYNPTDQAVNLSGWSVQYASTTGSAWQVTNLSGSIAAGGYYLIQQAQGTAGTTPLPTPDAVGAIPMAASNGKVALVSSTEGLTGTNPSTAINVVDFVGYGTANGYEGSGAAPALSNTTAAIRKNFMDTDNNNSDFETAAPNPRNSSYNGS